MLSYQDRYFSASDDRGNTIWYPDSVDETPFRGPYVPNLKQEEYDQLKLVKECHTKILDLSNEAELIVYNEIVDKCAKGHSMLRQEKFHPDKTWLLLIQWFDLFTELPNRLQHEV